MTVEVRIGGPGSLVFSSTHKLLMAEAELDIKVSYLFQVGLLKKQIFKMELSKSYVY